MSIQFAEEQENLKLDSDRLNVEKSCDNCQVAECECLIMDQVCQIYGSGKMNNFYCSEYFFERG